MKTKDTKHYRVNWIDGMKINKDHFIAMENSILEMVKSSAQKNISPISYGLLPQHIGLESSLDLVMSVDGQSTIEVVLNTCRAITIGGYQIDITQDALGLLGGSEHILRQQYVVNDDENEWYVVLAVDPFKRVEAGNSDAEEEPPRRPYVLAGYKLHILPKNETLDHEFGLHHITIGKIILENGKPAVAADFIPPCRTIQSHPDLQFTYAELGSFLNQMESYSLHIIQKIYQKKQTNDLANIALYISEQVMRNLNANITEFRLVDRYGPPIGMISKLVSLGRVIKSSLDVFVGVGKENFLNYLTNWCDLNQGAFENVLADTIELKYSHNDINLSLEKVSSFTKLMLSLFKKLSELEYIGKKEDSGIFVKEESVEHSEKKGRRSFLLD